MEKKIKLSQLMYRAEMQYKEKARFGRLLTEKNRQELAKAEERERAEERRREIEDANYRYDSEMTSTSQYP